MKSKIALPAFHITETTPYTVEADHPLTQLLSRYREFYKQVYNATVTESELLAEMARQFMERDREFQSFLKKTNRNTKRKSVTSDTHAARLSSGSSTTQSSSNVERDDRPLKT
jgi:hypothetical protein